MDINTFIDHYNDLQEANRYERTLEKKFREWENNPASSKSYSANKDIARAKSQRRRSDFNSGATHTNATRQQPYSRPGTYAHDADLDRQRKSAHSKARKRKKPTPGTSPEQRQWTSLVPDEPTGKYAKMQAKKNKGHHVDTASLKAGLLFKGERRRSLRTQAVNSIRRALGGGYVTEELEFVLSHLVTERFVDNYDAALAILESMSDEWFEDILFEGKKPLPIDKMLNQLQRHSYYSGWNRGGAEENRWNRAKREENSRKVEAVADKRASGIKKVISQHFNREHLELFERNRFERESEKNTGVSYDRRDLEHIRNQRHSSISGGSPSHTEDPREHNASTKDRREFNQGKYQKNIRKNHHKGVRVNTLLVGKEGDQIPVTNITNQYKGRSINTPEKYHLGTLRRRKLERIFSR